MSKKRFSEGLDDLFSDDKTLSSGGLFGSPASPPTERRSGHKNFMSDLDALLQDALDESLANQETDNGEKLVSGSKSGSSTRPSADDLPHGLDSLIRQTIDIQGITSDEATGKRRLTVSVDKTKIEKLKAIARLENAYMRDLLIALIDEYIQEYSNKKGLDI